MKTCVDCGKVYETEHSVVCDDCLDALAEAFDSTFVGEGA